jgi:hypothetical protein
MRTFYASSAPHSFCAGTAALWPDGYGVDGGGMRRFVACSNAYASSIRRGSAQAVPVKPTPNGAGFASN